MYTALIPNEAQPGTAVDFYLNTKDKMPTLKTKITAVDEDGRGKVWIAAEGVDDWFPPYHFALSTSQVSYGCNITNPLDSLHATKGY